jgi:hypothetical protein
MSFYFNFIYKPTYLLRSLRPRFHSVFSLSLFTFLSGVRIRKFACVFVAWYLIEVSIRRALFLYASWFGRFGATPKHSLKFLQNSVFVPRVGNVTVHVLLKWHWRNCQLHCAECCIEEVFFYGTRPFLIASIEAHPETHSSTPGLAPTSYITRMTSFRWVPDPNICRDSDFSWFSRSFSKM